MSKFKCVQTILMGLAITLSQSAYSQCKKDYCENVMITNIDLGAAGPLVEINESLEMLSCQPFYGKLAIRPEHPNSTAMDALTEVAHQQKLPVDITFDKKQQACTIDSVTVRS